MGGQKTRNKPVMIKFGNRLRKIRKDKKLTQSELALKSGISTSQIARIELGKLNTTICTLEQISKAIDTELSTFFEGF